MKGKEDTTCQNSMEAAKTENVQLQIPTFKKERNISINNFLH